MRLVCGDRLNANSGFDVHGIKGLAIIVLRIKPPFEPLEKLQVVLVLALRETFDVDDTLNVVLGQNPLHKLQILYFFPL